MNVSVVEQANKIFIQTIKNVINARKNESVTVDDQVATRLFKLAQHHDLAHIFGKEISEQGLIVTEKIAKHFNKQQILSVLRYERINYEYKQLLQTLTQAEIDFVPLKGSVIRELYPEPWMRTSCDIDILVRENDLKRAVKVLKEKNGYTQEGRINYHDVSLFSPSRVHLELHFNVKEDEKTIDKLLEKIWDYCSPIKENSHEYRESNEFYVFHAVAHMLYHFASGGCGVRTFMDLYLILKNFDLDQEKLSKMVEYCGITEFYKQVKTLAFAWFGDGEHSEISKLMQDYVLDGGVYGTSENSMAVKHMTVKKRGSYMWRRIFMPYETLTNRYPTLKKHKWLTPFYQVRRWVEIIFNKDAGKLKKEMKAYDSVGEEKKKTVEFMFKELGIKDKV